MVRTMSCPNCQTVEGKTLFLYSSLIASAGAWTLHGRSRAHVLVVPLKSIGKTVGAKLWKPFSDYRMSLLFFNVF